MNDDWDDGSDRAHARHSHPETSHEAAQSITPKKKKAVQEAIYMVLSYYGPMCHTDLIIRYREAGHPWQSDQGIRSRCSELRDQGRVIDTGKRVFLPSGIRSTVWAAVR